MANTSNNNEILLKKLSVAIENKDIQIVKNLLDNALQNKNFFNLNEKLSTLTYSFKCINQTPINTLHQSDIEINQTLPKSSNERKNNYLYNPNKRINSVVPITKPKVLSQERNLREPKYFKDIFNLIDIDKWLDDVNIELQNMKNLKRFLRLQNGFPKELISSQSLVVSLSDNGIDYIFTFSPTLKLDSLRIIISIALQELYMKAPNGLKQAGRARNEKLNNVLLVNLIHTYTLKRTAVEKMKYSNIKDIEELDFIIGIKFEKIYINELLKTFKLEKCKPTKNLKPIENHELKALKFDVILDREAIGNLLYLAICTRPDILISVNRAVRKNKNPTLED
ncbi:hypothetical protein H8356DRAFT_1353926 [Neocallimastix lanati (nom. inval.)]|nr:hypothetical protein H8356DRAFT_1353926 [Neocallimastix sp. JGI-2020a]